MPSSKEDFEKLAPTLFQGNLWRKYLNRRKTTSEPLESTLKAFLTETLEVTKAFPEINGNLLATLSVSQLAQKASEKLHDHIGKQTKLSWYDRLKTYQTDIERQVARLEQTLRELSELGNKVASTKVSNTTLSDVIPCHEGDSVRTLTEIPTYQNFTQQADDSHYTLLLNFLKKAHEVDTLLTDLVLVNKAFVKGKEASLDILKNEVNLSQQLSSNGLICLLSFDENNILNLIKDKDHYFIHPSAVLKKLSPEELIFCVSYGIGIDKNEFFNALCDLHPILLDIFPMAAAIQLAKTTPVYGRAILLNPKWVTEMPEEDFTDIIVLLSSENVAALLAESIKNEAAIKRFVAILNDDKKRQALFNADKKKYGSLTMTWPHAFSLGIKQWMTDAKLVQNLTDDAFKDCFTYFAGHDFDDIRAKQPLFLQRLERFDSETLVTIFRMAKKNGMMMCGESFLRQPTLLAKLTTDTLLIRVFKLLSITENFNAIRNILEIDRRLTAQFLIQLVKKESLFSKYIDKTEELLLRFSPDEIYTYLTETICSDKAWLYFLNKQDVLQALTVEQLKKLSKNYTYKELFRQKNNDVIKNELSRRGKLTKINQAIDITQFEENSQQTDWHMHLPKFVLLALAVGLGIGIGVAYFYSAPLWVMISLSIGLGVTVVSGIAALIYTYINVENSPYQTTTTSTKKHFPSLNSTTEPVSLQPQYYPNPVTQQRHIGASLPVYTSHTTSDSATQTTPHASV